MNEPAIIGPSYTCSLLWIALFSAVTIDMMAIEFRVVDIIHGNSHRTGEAVMAVLILGIAAAIGSILVFAVPQIFQGTLVALLHPVFGGRARFFVLPALPLTAVLTWYCYEYLTLLWTPDRHGISISRYLAALGFQTPVTLFSLLYIDAGFRGTSKRPLLLAALAIAIASAVILGYVVAQQRTELSSSGR